MLTEIQLDALREVTNIGCGAAATALSQLLSGRRVDLEVTRSAVLTPEEIEVLLGGPDRSRSVVVVALRGGFEGRLLLAYNDPDALELALALAGPTAREEGEALSSVGKSVIMEVGNIVASAFLNAVSKVSGMILLPSVPSLVRDRTKKVVELLRIAPDLFEENEVAPSGKMLVLETRMSTSGAPGIDGHLIIVPRPEALGLLFQAVGLE